ncbi:lysophospholipid acyltransferase family protein [Pseudotabrizicola algicola]|uniref:Phospholipid/glycerol acyltransferase domain-containing protein n=1 Tax=Pseudotabrizicola algicola TaxID=2709381 RepID=A0A6B3RRX6_9RHOB|nr:lysophospholipid acyltransferase family protein [Pseudotabrizicola algicola]NEX48777.1 hypothetical protein [Pseudotabrizicola algicola]
MLSDSRTFDLDPLPCPVDFTYSHPGQSAFRRGLIRAVEWMSGQPQLRQRYLDWSMAGKRPFESVFEAALRILRLRAEFAGTSLLQIPATGGLLIVANHPFGIVDGLALGHLGLVLRGNVRILTNSLLCRVPEIDPHLLPIDFSGTPQGRRLTAESRRQAIDLLARGQVVVIFPAGGVATANRPLRGSAVDSPWHSFVGRLATVPGTTVLPVHLAGQNSRLFQFASHLSYPLRVALIFHETRRQIGRSVQMTLGPPIPAEDLLALDRDQVARELRRRTMALASPALSDPDECYIWPNHIRW